MTSYLQRSEPVMRRLRPASYAAETEPLAHCEIATMTTPRSQAFFNSAIRSARWGALPAPNVSNTTPLVGGKRKALTVAAGIPGKRRKVARRV